MERNKQHRTKQNAKYLRTRRDPFPSRLLATANEID